MMTRPQHSTASRHRFAPPSIDAEAHIRRSDPVYQWTRLTQAPEIFPEEPQDDEESWRYLAPVDDFQPLEEWTP